MKVLFLENRYKTHFWEFVANWLRQNGHEIYWIVQNHAFKPVNESNCFVIPYPTKKQIEDIKEIEVPHKIVSSNRGLNYFGVKNPKFLQYYYSKIHEYIEEISPDLVFGECTQFHELISIDVCKQKGILFLHPSSCRYPQSRFSFYQYDTLVPFFGEKVEKTKEELLEEVESILSGKSRPDYMINTYSPGKLRLIGDKIKLTIEYYRGEKFNTPNPLRKFRIDHQKKKNIEKWESLARQRVADKSRFNVLFPLQMQPEANIDVWGYPYSNQLDVIKKIIGALDDEDRLYLKPNPKSKYELEPSLLQLAKFSQVKFLEHKSKINEILPNIDLVITVTGTMTLECIFAKKPVLSFGLPMIDEQLNYSLSTSFESLKNDIAEVKIGKRKYGNDDPLKLIKFLYSSSFEGIIGDGFYNKKYLLDFHNMQAIEKSFLKVLEKLKIANSEVS